MSDGLQFDRAEPRRPSVSGGTCAACRIPFTDVYYLVSGRGICATCAEGLRKKMERGPSSERFGVALALGLLAACLGGGTWIGIWFLTNRGVSALVALGLGYLVGTAVKKGARGPGGWPYQAMAALLTYGSLVIGYLPPLLLSFSHRQAPLGLSGRIGFTLISPILAGVENPLRFVILGAGLVTAWVINRKTDFEIRGPFQVGASGLPGGTAGG
jgi:hypothetical protein